MNDYILENNQKIKKLEAGNIIINGDNNIIDDVIVNGTIIIYGSNNILRKIRFNNEDEGIRIYPKAIKNKIIECIFKNMRYGIVLYSSYNVIKDSFFFQNEYPLLICSSTNNIYNNQIYYNKNEIINKGVNNIAFNVFKTNKKVNNELSNGNHIIS